MVKQSSIFLVIFCCLCFSAGLSNASENKTHHGFSGSVLNLPAPTSTSEGALPCQKIKSSLIQVSSSMGQYVGDDIETGCSEALSLDLPEVKRITTLQLERTMYDETGQTDLAQVTIKVYPDDQLSGLKIWAMMNVLYIKDAEGHLLEALDRYDIGYQFRHSGLSADKSVELTAGQGRIVFKEETELLPMIKALPAMVTVEMPFLQGLSDDPAKQKVLADLFLNLKKTKKE